MFRTEVTVHDDNTSESSIARLRSAKRLKLSPASDFSSDGSPASIVPQGRRDYVGESRSLMNKIRQARDISMMSTHASAVTPTTSGKRPDSTDSPIAHHAGQSQRHTK